MGLTRPITRELTQILPRQLWQGLGLGKVEQILLDARAALNIHPEQQVGATYLAEQTPTIAGVVEDETPTHKDRTRLSCRASDFDGINQSFSGGNTSTSKTQLSAAVWIRPDQVSSAGGIFGEYDSGSTDIGWLINQSSNDFVVYISEDGGNTNWKSYQVSNLLVVGEWLHIAFTFDLDVGGGVNELLVYVNGKEVTPTKTADVNLTAIFDTTANIEVGKETTVEFDGQIQQPLIYEGVWTPAEVRDLYLQKTDASITYGWFLDSDTAHPLTSSSPALTPANSPDLYEDDAIGGGDWLNEKGWNGAAEFNNVDTEIVFPSDISLTGDFEISVDLKGGGVNNFVGDDTSPLNLAYSNAATVVLKIANNTKVFNFGTSFNNTSFATVVITRTSGVTTITKDGETAPETLVEAGTFTISRLGRERNQWFEGQIRNFKIVDAGATILDWPLVENSNDVSGNGNDGTDSANVVYVAIPKRWDEELDSDGVAATDSTSFGVARRNGQLRGGPCFSFGGTEYATNGNLVGTETVVSSEGTSTPTISAGRIDFTAGTCWNLLLSNGSHYAGSERTGIIWHDDVNDEHLTFFNSPNWSTQDSYFWNENKGYSLYEHASEPDLFVPLKSDGTALTITPPSGYTKTSDNPAGPWLYEGDETYVDFDVVANANQWLEQRWQDTEGDGVGYLTLDSAITLSGAFDVEFLHYASSYASAESIIGHSSETSQIGFSSTKYFIRVLNGGSSDNTIAAPSINQWHSVKIARDSSDIVTATIDGTETTLFSGAAQSGDFVINQIFKGTLGIFTGNVRNVKITDDTTIIMDFDSLIDIDLSSSVNHATETATDITFNRLTDTSYTAGDVVEQPFSVNDDISGRVSELIQFTFPVTTISSTPTISQTVFEDGNTVTQDGILISES